MRRSRLACGGWAGKVRSRLTEQTGLRVTASNFLLRRHPNVSFDISGLPPIALLRYYPWLERVADKTMFGSDWPGPGVKDIGDNIQQFLSLDLSDEVKRKILRENALRIFNLG
jgi:predicted TIM-barrel fold metal-dependent hydrolase